MSESKDEGGKNDVQRRRIGYEKPRLILLGEVKKAYGVDWCNAGTNAIFTCTDGISAHLTCGDGSTP